MKKGKPFEFICEINAENSHQLENLTRAELNVIINSTIDQINRFNNLMRISLKDFLDDIPTQRVGRIYIDFSAALFKIIENDYEVDDAIVVITTKENKTFFHSTFSSHQKALDLMITEFTKISKRQSN